MPRFTSLYAVLILCLATLCLARRPIRDNPGCVMGVRWRTKSCRLGKRTEKFVSSLIYELYIQFLFTEEIDSVCDGYFSEKHFSFAFKLFQNILCKVAFSRVILISVYSKLFSNNILPNRF